MVKSFIKKSSVLLAAAVFAFLNFSCSNPSGGFDGGTNSGSKQSYPIVLFTANISADCAAAPKEISRLVSASSESSAFSEISRSAFPSVTISEGGACYYVEATVGSAGQPGYKRVFSSGTSSTLGVELVSGYTWKIVCGIGTITATSDPNSGEITELVNVSYMSSEPEEFTISSDEPVLSRTFALKPSTGGTGTVKLKMTVPTGYTVTSECPACSLLDGDWDMSGTVAKLETDAAAVPSGAYEIIIKVLAPDTLALVFYTNQTINVFNGMTTSEWRDDGSGAFKTVYDSELLANVLWLYIDSTIITRFADNMIYVGDNEWSASVGKSADNLNAGTAFAPLEDLSEAAIRIGACGNGKDYTIFVSGTIVGGSEFNSDDGVTTAKAKSISIVGLGTDAVLDGNASSSVVAVNTTVPMKFKNIQITNGVYDLGGGIRIEADGADVTLENGTLVGDATELVAEKGEGQAGNMGTVGGGGIYNHGGKLLLKSGSKICRNYGGAAASEYDGDGGGGILCDAGSVTIEKGAVISYNATNSRGGGLRLKEGGGAISLTMKGGEISDNQAIWGGGVLMGAADNITFTMNGGKLYKNSTMVDSNGWACGGAIYMDGGVFTMTGGEISGNTSLHDTGGVYFKGNDSVTGTQICLSGGVFKDNEPRAIALVAPTIAKTFYLSGSVSIPYGGSVGKNDIYVENGNLITINGSFDGSATISTNLWGRGKQVLQASSSSVEITQDIASKFALVDPDFSVKESRDGTKGYIDAPIYVASSIASTRKTCTGAPSDGTDAAGTRTAPYATIERALGECTDESCEYTINIDGKIVGANSVPGTVATFKGAGLTIAGCNGDNDNDVLDANGSDAVLSVDTSVPITIKNLKLTGGSGSGDIGGGGYAGGGINLKSGLVELSDGAWIAGNVLPTDHNSYGGGVFVASGAKLLMNGSALIGSKASISGAATSSTVGRNEANFGAGVYCYGTVCLGYSEWTSDTVNKKKALTGGIIGNYNSQQSGGGVWSRGTLVMDSGNISHNKAKEGGGVQVANGTFTMQGGTLAANNASDSGGGVRVGEDGTFEMFGGQIGGDNSGDKNTVDNVGGGAVSSSGTFKIKDSAYIPYVKFKENDVYLSEMGGVQKTIEVLSSSLSRHSETKPLVVGAVCKRGAVVLELGSYTEAAKCFKFSQDGWSLITTGANAGRIDAPMYVKKSVNAVDSPTFGATLSMPFKTIEFAASQAWNTLEETTIYVDGTLTDCQTITTLAEGVKGIVLEGTGDSGAVIQPAYANDTATGSVLAISADNAKVKIQKLRLTGGRGTYVAADEELRGGGLYICPPSDKGALVTLGAGSKIDGNKVVDIDGVSTTSCSGGGAYVCAGSTLWTTDGSQISDNIADMCGGGVYNAGTLVVGSSIIGATDAEICEKLEVDSLDGQYANYDTTAACKSFSNRTSEYGYGGGVYNDGGGILYLGYKLNDEGVPEMISDTAFASLAVAPAVSFNYGGTEGGGVFVDTNSAFYMGAAWIKRNSGASGGGLYNKAKKSGSTYKALIQSAKARIFCNHALALGDAGGGGIYNIGDIKMTKGSIYKNSAAFGGGVYNWGNKNASACATFTLSGSSSSSASIGGGTDMSDANVATTQGGGVYNKGIFVMDGEGSYVRYNKVESNTANVCGGGIYNAYIFTMTDGKIQGNRAIASASGAKAHGGGLYHASAYSGILTYGAGDYNCISGGQITLNSVTANLNLGEAFGAGVYIQGGTGLYPLAFVGGVVKTNDIPNGKTKHGSGVYISGISGTSYLHVGGSALVDCTSTGNFNDIYLEDENTNIKVVSELDPRVDGIASYPALTYTARITPSRFTAGDRIATYSYPPLTTDTFRPQTEKLTLAQTGDNSGGKYKIDGLGQIRFNIESVSSVSWITDYMTEKPWNNVEPIASNVTDLNNKIILLNKGSNYAVVTIAVSSTGSQYKDWDMDVICYKNDGTFVFKANETDMEVNSYSVSDMDHCPCIYYDCTGTTDWGGVSNTLRWLFFDYSTGVSTQNSTKWYICD